VATDHEPGTRSTRHWPPGNRRHQVAVGHQVTAGTRSRPPGRGLWPGSQTRARRTCKHKHGHQLRGHLVELLPATWSSSGRRPGRAAAGHQLRGPRIAGQAARYPARCRRSNGHGPGARHGRRPGRTGSRSATARRPPGARPCRITAGGPGDLVANNCTRSVDLVANNCRETGRPGGLVAQTRRPIASTGAAWRASPAAARKPAARRYQAQKTRHGGRVRFGETVGAIRSRPGRRGRPACGRPWPPRPRGRP
jgi:hypothetical protein